MAAKKNKKNSAKTLILNQDSNNSLTMLAAIFVLTTIVYSGSFKNGFTDWDDPGYIINNKLIKNLSWNGIKKMFTEFYAGNYHPFTALSNAIEFHFWGLKPQAYHIINFVFHLFNICFVYFLTLKISNKKNIALLTSVFMAIHPTHIESVAWVSERKDVLYTFFLLPAFYFYIKYITENKNKYIIFSFLLFLCSVLSKSTAVIFPLLTIIADIYFRKKFDGKNILNKILFFTVAIVFGIIATSSQKETIDAFTTPDFSLVERILIVCRNLIYYLIYSIFPFTLSNLHPFPDAGDLGIEYYISPFIILGLLYFLYKIRKHPLAVFGILFFVISNLLTLQFFPLGKAVMAERYTYLPYVGLFITFGYFLFQENTLKKYSAYTIPFVFVLVLIFSYASFQRVKVWKNSATLWNDCTTKYPQGYFGWYCNAMAQSNQQTAIKYYTRCIELKPDFPDVYANRSSAYGDLKMLRESINDANKALKLRPNILAAINNRGAAYQDLGMPDSALMDYMTCIKLNPDNSYLYLNVGTIYLDQKNYENAIKYFSASLSLDSANGRALYNRGLSYNYMNKKDSACNDFYKALSSGEALARNAINLLCRK